MTRFMLRALCLTATLFLAVACTGQGADEERMSEARASFSSGQYLEAEKQYQAYLQVMPHGKYRWEAWTRLLDVAVNVRTDPNKATGLLEAMFLEFGSDSGRVWYILSRASELYASQRQWDKANDALQRCLNLPDIDPELIPEIRYRLATIYAKQGENDLALDSLDVCTAKAVDVGLKSRCLYAQSQTLSNMQALEMAESRLRELIALTGVDEEQRALAIFLLADIQEQEGRHTEARELLESIRDTYPNPKAVEKRIEHLKEAPGK